MDNRLVWTRDKCTSDVLELNRPHTTFSTANESTCAAHALPHSGGSGGLEVTTAGRALHIGSPDSLVMYPLPGLHLLSSYDFTIELWYRTQRQPQVQHDVAIISSVRDSTILNAGRGLADVRGMKSGAFSIFMRSGGEVAVAYSADDRVVGQRQRQQPHMHGAISTSRRYDDGAWHHVSVMRRFQAGTLALYVDHQLHACGSMPPGVDLSDWRPLYMGGGNDRHWRECAIDEVRLWRVARPPSACIAPLDTRDLVGSFSFEADTVAGSTFIEDDSPIGGGAIRIGGLVAGVSPGVVPGVGGNLLCKLASTTSHPKRKLVRTVAFTTLLSAECNSGTSQGSMHVAGHEQQVEAYIAPLVLDATRLRLPLYILHAGCFHRGMGQAFSSPYVHFVNVSRVRSNLTRACPRQRPLMDRWAIELNFLRSGLLSSFSHAIGIDLRDGRINRVPQWAKLVPANANHTRLLWLQTVRGEAGHFCGGMHAGSLHAMTRLATEMAADRRVQGSCSEDFDQNIFAEKVKQLQAKADLLVKVDRPLINSQHVSMFGETVLEHGAGRFGAARREPPKVAPYRAGTEGAADLGQEPDLTS